MAPQPSGTVSLLFTDIEGSTRLLAAIGPERYARTLDEHRALLRASFERHGGYEVDAEGDAFFVAFPTAAAAVAAAAEGQQALAAHAWPDRRELRVRMGVHTGQPVSAPPKYVGMDVHRAARIMSAAHGGQVLVSAATAALLRPDDPESRGLILTDLGSHRFKDLLAPDRVFQLGDGAFPPISSLDRSNLPVPTTAFLGRQHELDEVVELLSRADVRLVTLTGPGGTGKTRLAVQAAAEVSHAFPEGVWWVPLAPLHDPALVLSSIAQAVEAREQPGRELLETLAERLGRGRSILVVDNAEHLLPELAVDLSRLRAVAPLLVVLVTSRERLQLSGEEVWPVPALADQDGVELFLTRARSVGRELADSQAVRELCLRLDNLPLALELAAARLVAFSPEQLLERLGQRLDLLKGGRDTDPRQVTLRATIAWSFDLLGDEEQRLLARLSVFAGGMTYDSAEQVCEADPDTLQALLDKSLLQRRDGDLGSRYWMLETIREFAAEQLDERGESDRLALRHVECFVVFAEEAERASRAGERESWFDRLEAEHDNLRSALAVSRVLGDTTAELRLVTALWRFWADRGYVSEGLRRLEAALEHSPNSPSKALIGRCYLRTMTGGGYAAALSEANAIAAACEREGDEYARVQALSLIGMIQNALGQDAAAETALDRALEIAGGRFPAEEAEATAWLLIGALFGALPSEQGIGRCKDAFRRAGGNLSMQAFALVERAPLEAMRGEFDTARRLLRDGREIFHKLDLKVYGANTAQEGYLVEKLAGDLVAAADTLHQAFELLAEMGERSFLSTIAGHLAHVEYARGRIGAAERFCLVSAEAAAQDDLTSQCLWRGVRAKLLAQAGDIDEACRLGLDALRLLEPTGFLNTAADRLTDYAEVLVLAGRTEEACGALREALMRYERKGNLVSARATRSALAALGAPA